MFPNRLTFYFNYRISGDTSDETGDVIKIIPALPAPIHLTDKQQIKAENLKRYMTVMDRLSKNNESVTTQEAYKTICIEVANITQVYNHPSRSTLSRHFKKYQKTGNVRTLFTSDSLRRNRLDETIEDFLNNFISSTWHNLPHENIHGAYHLYKKRATENGVDIASYSTFHKRILQLPSFDKTMNLSDKRTRNKILSTRSDEITVNGILHRVELDRCDLNLCLIDSKGNPTSKVSIYAAIDCYSRAIMGLTVELGTSEDTEGVVRLLAQMYMNKQGHPFSGVIKEIFTDNGPGFRSEIVTEICSRLNTTIIRTPAESPFKKPFIESFFNVLGNHLTTGVFKIGNKEYVGLPGYKGVLRKKSKISDSSTAEKRAKLNIDDFMIILREFLFQYNHKWTHSSLKKTPFEKWQEGEETLPAIPVNYDALRHVFHFETKSCQLLKGGYINLKTQVYQNAALAELYHTLLINSMQSSPTIDVRYNPGDAGMITVYAKHADNSPIPPIQVRHKSWGKSDQIVAFDEVKGGPRIRSNLFEVTLEGANSAKPAKSKKQTFKNSHVPSFEENRAQGLTHEEIIEKSQNEFAHKNKPEHAMINRAKRTAKQQDNKIPIQPNRLLDDEETW
ncbi:hypothetical protein [Alishewanella sp. HL-SH05]|uniref:hypothetical protein n=1 Tax=Alishewanella sp. HL-SH05 TaxID=3461145 RepID=UPI004041689A